MKGGAGGRGKRVELLLLLLLPLPPLPDPLAVVPPPPLPLALGRDRFPLPAFCPPMPSPGPGRRGLRPASNSSAASTNASDAPVVSCPSAVPVRDPASGTRSIGAAPPVRVLCPLDLIRLFELSSLSVQISTTMNEYTHLGNQKRIKKC